jgi:putative membrane protein
MLNGASMLFLVAARVLVAQGRIEAHRRAMLAALGVSALFLLSYLAYHVSSPIFVFRGQGLVRPLYYALLVSHVVLAAIALPLILMTAWLGLKRIVLRHQRWARWTWPLWMYVSASGVAVYLMLYRIDR